MTIIFLALSYKTIYLVYLQIKMGCWEVCAMIDGTYWNFYNYNACLTYTWNLDDVSFYIL